ncbi:MAG TPA: hypothetical protein VFN35_04920 [Ktedonobacteraceae bacterium]|nr:hypothetical protein [Ktedonobacteraceae bacterium]
MSEAEEEQKRSNWHRPLAGPQRPGAAKRVGVYGKSQEQAYSRRSEAKPVTFSCVVCGQEKTEYRYPGFRPRYCSDACYSQAVEKRNQERVEKQREKRQREREARQSSNGGL